MKTDPQPCPQRRLGRGGFGDAVGDAISRHVLAQPAMERRAAFGAIRPDKAVFAEIFRSRWQPLLLYITPRRIKAHAHAEQRLHHVVRLLWRSACADGDMRLAVIQPEQPHIGQKADHNRRMLRRNSAKTGVSKASIPVIAVTTNSPATVSPCPLIRLASWPNCSSVVCATSNRSRPASVGV